MNNPRDPFRNRAFTLAELMVALVIITMVGVAVASVGEAVFKGWKATEDQANLDRSVNGAVSQLETILRSARWIGTAYNDANLGVPPPNSAAVAPVEPLLLPPGAGAACMIWTGESSTSQMLLKDIKVIEHNMVDGSLVLWMVPETASNGNTVMATSDIATPQCVAAFKGLPNMVGRTIATGVRQCSFTGWSVNSSTNIRTVEAAITFEIGDKSQIWHGSMTPLPIASSEATLLN